MKGEHWRIDVFELWCWRRLLRVPWTARRSKQSILKKISPEYSLDGLMLKLKFPYFDHLMQRTDSLEKTLLLGNIEGRGRRGQERMRWLDRITNSMSMSLSEFWKLVKDRKPGMLQFMGSQRVKHNWATEWNWTKGDWIGLLVIHVLIQHMLSLYISGTIPKFGITEINKVDHLF